MEEKKLILSEALKAKMQEFAKAGKTPLIFAEEQTLLGVIAVADVVKETSKEAVDEFRKEGIHVIMLTGDNEVTAQAIKQQVGIDEVIAGVLPALAAADVGIAIGAGTDVAIESADIVLMKNDLLDAVGSIRLSKAVIRNIKQNLFWAFFYNSIGIPVAAGLLYPIWGIRLNPMFGAAAMSLSSVCVVSNALRLKGLRLRKEDKKQEEREEKKSMTTTLNIEGMMCGHCQGRVEKALQEVPGVTAVTVSLEAKNAVVTSEDTVSKDALKAAVVDAGYDVTGVN